MRRTSMIAAALALASSAALAAGLTPTAKTKIKSEWMTRTGTTREALNNTRIFPDLTFHNERKPEDTVPAGSKVVVREIDFPKNEVQIDLQIAGTKQWTEVHFVFPALEGDLTAEQREQLQAMWDKLIAGETPGE